MLDTSDDAIFTEAHAGELTRRGTCGKEHKYIGKTIRKCINAEPRAALEFALDWLSDAQFERAAKADPWAALEFAPYRLSDKQFERAATAALWAALEFAPDRARRMGLI